MIARQNAILSVFTALVLAEGALFAHPIVIYSGVLREDPGGIRITIRADRHTLEHDAHHGADWSELQQTLAAVLLGIELRDEDNNRLDPGTVRFTLDSDTFTASSVWKPSNTAEIITVQQGPSSFGAHRTRRIDLAVDRDSEHTDRVLRLTTGGNFETITTDDDLDLSVFQRPSVMVAPGSVTVDFPYALTPHTIQSASTPRECAASFGAWAVEHLDTDSTAILRTTVIDHDGEPIDPDHWEGNPRLIRCRAVVAVSEGSGAPKLWTGFPTGVVVVDITKFNEHGERSKTSQITPSDNRLPTP